MWPIPKPPSRTLAQPAMVTDPRTATSDLAVPAMVLQPQRLTLLLLVSGVARGKQDATRACLAVAHASEATPSANTLIHPKANVYPERMSNIFKIGCSHWRRNWSGCQRINMSLPTWSIWLEVLDTSGSKKMMNRDI